MYIESIISILIVSIKTYKNEQEDMWYVIYLSFEILVKMLIRVVLYENYEKTLFSMKRYIDFYYRPMKVDYF
jgi:hypothetical protein